MRITPKELWAVAPKLQMALKKILTSKRMAKESLEPVLETNESRSQKNLVLVNSLGSPEIRQESLEVDNRERADPVLQFLENLEPDE